MQQTSTQDTSQILPQPPLKHLDNNYNKSPIIHGYKKRLQNIIRESQSSENSSSLASHNEHKTRTNSRSVSSDSSQRSNSKSPQSSLSNNYDRHLPILNTQVDIDYDKVMLIIL